MLVSDEETPRSRCMNAFDNNLDVYKRVSCYNIQYVLVGLHLLGTC